jgi:hypothetical protein
MPDLVPFEYHQPTTRASDAERQAVVAVLQLHFAEGRLDVTELESRAAAALASRTQGDLVPLLSDLPAVATPTAPARVSGPPLRHRQRTSAFDAYLRVWIALAVMFIVIWALTPGGYFWPIWPMFGTGIPLVALFAARGGGSPR